MRFVLPELQEAHCQQFTACSRVVTRDKSVKRLFSRESTLVACVKEGGLKRFARLCISKEGHVHLDLASPEYFAGGGVPKPKHSWNRIESSLRRFVGHQIKVQARALFAVSLARLPESSVIRLLSSVESRMGVVSMKLTGGTFAIAGAPVQRIAWVVRRDMKQVKIQLQLTQERTLREMYLADLFNLLTKSFNVLVTGNEKN